MTDETPRAEPVYSGPRCPSCQMPTKSHCVKYPIGCPWLVCVNRHVIRPRDSHIEDEPTSPRPHALTDPRNDGLFDQRGNAYWDRFYPVDQRPRHTQEDES